MPGEPGYSAEPRMAAAERAGKIRELQINSLFCNRFVNRTRRGNARRVRWSLRSETRYVLFSELTAPATDGPRCQRRTSFG